MRVQKNLVAASHNESVDLVIEELQGVGGANSLAMSCCCCCCCCKLCCSTCRDNNGTVGAAG